MARLTSEIMNMANAVRMAMLHSEAIEMDRARDEAIAKHPGLVCHYQYTMDSLGRPLVVLEESEIPY